MKVEKTGKRRLFQRTSDKVFLGVVIALALLTIALAVLQRCGLMPINGAILMYVPLMTLFVLVGWGVYALVRRISNRTVKILVGILGGLALVVVLLLVFTYVAYLSFYLIPQKYTAVTSPSGSRKVVVLRVFDADEERTEARKAARLAANPDGADEDSVEDWGFMYSAYPQVMGLFYRANADVEGEVYLAIDTSTLAVQNDQGEASSEGGEAPEAVHGTLMVEWLEEESVAHFFVENPGVAEGGDCYVRF